MALVITFLIVVVIGFSWVALVEHLLTLRHLSSVQYAHEGSTQMTFFYIFAPIGVIVHLTRAAFNGRFLATIRSIANGSISAV